MSLGTGPFGKLRAGSSTSLRMTLMKSFVPTLSQKMGKDGAPRFKVCKEIEPNA